MSAASWVEIGTEIEMSAAAVLIIGVGNEFRRDDGAGLVVARALCDLALPRTRIVEHTGEAGALMDTWRGADHVFVIDAARAYEAPSAITRFEAHDTPVPARFLSTSTHDLGVTEAIELSRLIGCLPQRLVVYAIIGYDFGMGAQLSAPVERACSEVAARIAGEVCGIVGQRKPIQRAGPRVRRLET